MIKLQELFEVSHGNKFDLNKMNQLVHNVNFIGRSSKNNGVTAIVDRYNDVEPYKEGLITVALGGSILASFLQPKPFYTGQNIAILKPLLHLSELQMLFYCKAISSNNYRFSTCGREANRTLKYLLIPSPSNIPDWVYSVESHNLDKFISPIDNTSIDLTHPMEWKDFCISDLFLLKKGKRLTKENMTQGHTPFIGAIDSNNGLSALIGQAALHPKGAITVSYNGSVAEAFYQPKNFWATDDINVLYPKFNMLPEHALFICTIIKKEKYRFNYGRKWHLERMNGSTIRLPSNTNGEPDWDFMNSYIKTLPFSSVI